MPTHSIQCHITRVELFEFLEWAMAVRGVVRVELSFWPAKTRRVLTPGRTVRLSSARSAALSFVYFDLLPPRRRRPRRFQMSVGHLRGNRLDTTLFGGRPDEPDLAALVRTLVRRLHRMTPYHALITSPTGHTGRCAFNRISVGAARGWRDGSLELVLFGSSQQVDVYEPVPDPPPAPAQSTRRVKSEPRVESKHPARSTRPARSERRGDPKHPARTRRPPRQRLPAKTT